MASKSPLRSISHQADLCIVGGGMSGLCAAVAAARRGTRVILMQDRPMLGGNASSEIRMWIWGARGRHNRETGIIEELLLDNLYYNPLCNYSIWDNLLYGKAQYQDNLTLLLNCSCNEMEMDGNRILSIKGWQTTTQTWHTVEASLFADCSGDSILAPLSGAEVRVGREAKAEFNESIAPEEGDRQTMGMSCLIQPRETDQPQSYIAPPWANKYPSPDDLPHRDHDLRTNTWMWNNFWWIELGGDRDSIHDTELLREELTRAAFGIWDHIKNHGDHGAENWVLDFIGCLPGKRESRRYVGDHIVTENDVRAQRMFDDIVAYAGWPMDDHHPAGLNHPGEPSVLYPVKPWGIPLRALYSRNIDNLFCAGRNISVSHAALSSSRVMATCSIIGQAVGTAAAIAVQHATTPRGVYQEHIAELQQALLEDDCFLPSVVRDISSPSQKATITASEGDPEPLRDGVDRPIGDTDHGWHGPPESWVEYRFEQPTRLNELRLVFDSHLNRRSTTMLCKYPLEHQPVSVPDSMTRAFRIEILDAAVQWTSIAEVENNFQRLIRLKTDVTTQAVRFIPEKTWGAKTAHLFAWEIL